MKLIPEDQLLTAPGLEREKIKVVAISVGVGGVSFAKCVNFCKV
jgi:hypothetical protein